jgi:hypothetical protein
MLSVSRTTMYKLIGSGAIKTRIVGRRRLVLVSSLREFVRSDHPNGG